MSTTLIVLLVILGLIVLIALWSIGVYNSFVRLKALLDEAWSGIDVQLKRRYDLIPNLVATVKGYSIHEKGVLEEVTRLRSVSMNAKTIDEKSQAESQLTQTLKTLFAVSEQYPDLKANQNFMALQKELTSIEDQVQLSRRYYNGAARNYNVGVSSFPSSIVANMYGFSKVPYFELTNSSERDVPKVNF
jgi:LemA protein